MAKRTGAPKLQEDIQTDEDLKNVLDRPGLWGGYILAFDSIFY